MQRHDLLPVTDDPTAADLSELDDRINAFNADRTGIHDARYLSIMLRSDDGDLCAGLHGHSWGGCCEIKLLWVAEDRRGQGLGSHLLQSAEVEAVRRGCRLILLATHSFQAPGFYRGHSFSRIATVDGCPEGHAEIFMMKLLPR
jgi:GNAT superfamily N-acetyltransferase